MTVQYQSMFMRVIINHVVPKGGTIPPVFNSPYFLNNPNKHSLINDTEVSPLRPPGSLCASATAVFRLLSGLEGRGKEVMPSESATSI